MTILSICSARPNFVKLAAVHHAFEKLKKEGDMHVIVHTGQHYDPLLSDVFFEQLKIPQPNKNLGVHGGKREEVIERTMMEMLPVLQEYRPNMVLVYGDVNGAVGAARAAKKLGIAIAHVEAGLRSFDMDMPEELNRIEIDELADLLLVSEQAGAKNLQKGKAKAKKVELVGNTMIDTLIRMLPAIDTLETPSWLPDKFAVATLHRPSNVDAIESLLRVMGFLNTVSEYMTIVLPMHPRFRQMIEKPDPERTTIPGGLFSGNLKAIEPLGYLEFLKLMKLSQFILTDSGGIQEEAVALKKRCFTLRRNTERPSTIESGSNVLIDPSKKEDREIVLDFAKHPVTPQITIPDKWDNETGERILRAIRTFLS